MDADSVRAMVQFHLDQSAVDADLAHEIYHADAVLEFPQSGERFEGVENFREWRKAYPADVELRIERVRGADQVWTVEVQIRYDGGPWKFGVAIYELRGEKVAAETIYYGEPWEPPEWRARWRAAPPATSGQQPSPATSGTGP